VHDGPGIVFSEQSSRELGERERLRYKIDGDRLTISFSTSGFTFGWNASKHLTVRLPRTALALLDIDNVSGEVRVSGVTADEVKVDTVSGELALMSIAAGDLRINSVSGDATIALSAPPQKVKMDSVSGDCDLALPEGYGFTAKLDSVSGKLRCSFASAAKGEALVYGDGAADWDFDSVSGDVEIAFAKPAPIEAVPTAVPTKEPGDTAPASGRSF
jgi:hypothetical protein